MEGDIPSTTDTADSVAVVLSHCIDKLVLDEHSGDGDNSSTELPNITDDDDQLDDQMLEDAVTNTIETKELPKALPKPFPDDLNTLTDTEISLCNGDTELSDDLRTMRIEISKLSTENQKLIDENELLMSRLSFAQAKADDDSSASKLSEMEKQIEDYKTKLSSSEEKLRKHDEAAKQAVASLRSDLKSRLTALRRRCDDASQEKEEMVVKFAQAERKCMDMKKEQERSEEKMKDMIKDKELLLVKVKTLRAENQKFHQQGDSKTAECRALYSELEKQKDLSSNAEVKMRWLQNKLKSESEAHKDTKAKLEDSFRKLKETREESEQVRKDCQQMIKKYQESEEMKSSSLDQELKRKMGELQRQKEDQSGQEHINAILVSELDSAKTHQKESAAEVKALREKMDCLKTELSKRDDKIGQLNGQLNDLNGEKRELTVELSQLKESKENIEKVQAELRKLRELTNNLRESNQDLVGEMELCKAREAELLSSMQRLTNRNAQMQAEANSLTNKAMSSGSELQRMVTEKDLLKNELNRLKSELNDERGKREREISELSRKLTDKSKMVEELAVKTQDAEDLLKTMRKKHSARVKDLTRELRRALDKESDKNSVASNDDTSSFEMVDTDNNHQPPPLPVVQEKRSSPPILMPQEDFTMTRTIEPNRQMLIEKIVKLQRQLARRTEKIEFLQEHVDQLVEEIKKKNRLIQYYMCREESGALSSDAIEVNKVDMSRKGGIMASLYSTHPQDDHMSLELSLNISRKLQAVLEDTILKNITLKESMETLGEEISKLSQENRTLKLSIHNASLQ